MKVMPSNSSGWFWHCLARETGNLGHLYSPDGQRGPWPWFPFALDNGAFSCWDMRENSFDEKKWEAMEQKWKRLLFWAQTNRQKPLWAIVPDQPGNKEMTFQKWHKYVGDVKLSGIPVCLAVQDGMTVEEAKALSPDVIAVGGTTGWKWDTVEIWASNFKRVHVLRVNSPQKLHYLEQLGVESCDGTGWNRGDRVQTFGLESWARKKTNPTQSTIADFTCRQAKDKKQVTFA